MVHSALGWRKTGNKPSPTPTKFRRQQEIERLVKKKRQLKKQWRKAPEEEKVGINLLQTEIKKRLVTLRRAENLRRRHKMKEQARSNVFKDPFKFAKNLFTKEKSGKLKASKKDLEPYLKQSHTDSQQVGETTLPPVCQRYIPQNISWTSPSPQMERSRENCTSDKSCILPWAQWSTIPAV